MDQFNKSPQFLKTQNTAQSKDLLLQVENLKDENCSLKKELSNNSSQINRLKSEASNLKEIVIKLNYQMNLDNQSILSNAPENIKFSQLMASHLIPSSNSYFMGPANSECASEIRWKIMCLQQQRCSIVESLKREENVQKAYIDIINNLNIKFRDILKSRKCTNCEESITIQSLDGDIRNLIENVKKDMGICKLKQQRLQNLLQQIQATDSNLHKLQNHLILLNTSEDLASSTICSMIEKPFKPVTLPFSNLSMQEKKVECNVLKHLEVIRQHCTVLFLNSISTFEGFDENILKAYRPSTQIFDQVLHSVQILMENSYSQPTLIVMNKLGGLYCFAELLVLNCGAKISEKCLKLCQYASCVLTMLTFEDHFNKLTLLNMECFMKAVIGQLNSASEQVQQNMSNILFNLSWNADQFGKDCLSLSGIVTILTNQAMKVKNESTLISMLGVLWNLSSHSLQNKKDICLVSGLLAFLVSLLSYESPSKTLSVVESAGGILLQVSSVIAEKDHYREVLRKQNCLEVLLKQLASSSLTIVSNACGTLWNLSLRDETDQLKLLELGAIEKLQNLVHSRHSSIAQGSDGVLQNILASKAAKSLNLPSDLVHKSQHQSLQNCLKPSFQSSSMISNSVYKHSINSKIHAAQTNTSLLCSSAGHSNNVNLAGVDDSNSSDSQSLGTWAKSKPENTSVLPTNKICNSKIVSPRMPTDLAKKLQDTYAAYDTYDDHVVNYSLQYKETELNSSLCQATSNHENAVTFAKPLHNITTNCENSNPKQNKLSGIHNSSFLQRPKIDPSVEKKLLFADKEIYEPEETPTNFGAIYREDCLDDDDNFLLSQFKGGNKIDGASADEVKRFSIENTPVCYSTNGSVGSLSNLHGSTTTNNHNDSPKLQSHDLNSLQVSNANKSGRVDKRLNEESEKYGIVTPRYYYSKSNRQSGYMTPNLLHDTPMMIYSPNESRSSLDSCDQNSIHSDLSSAPDSTLQSGYASFSELPDSPGHSMPESRCRSPTNNTNNKNQSKVCKPNGIKHDKVESINLKELTKKTQTSSICNPLVPNHDEAKVYNYETALSIVTSLSELSVDGEKVSMLKNCLSDNNNVKPAQNNNTGKQSSDMHAKISTKDMSTVLHAGYIPSLPSCDEITHYCLEKTFSPFTALSEISGIHSHNDGFQKNQNKTTQTTKNYSHTSQTCGTGASIPLSVESQHDPAKDEKLQDASTISTNICAKSIDHVKLHNNTDRKKSNNQTSIEASIEKFTDIKSDKSSVFINDSSLKLENKANVDKINDVGYIQSIPSFDEIHSYAVGEGTISPMTALSEISVLKNLNEGFQNPVRLQNSRTSAISGSVSNSVAESNVEIKKGLTQASPKHENTCNGQENNLDDSDIIDLLNCSSEDEVLLKQVIESAIPKKRTNSRSKSTKTNTSNRKDKIVKKVPGKKLSLAVVDENMISRRTTMKLDTTDRRNAAESRLNGLHIADYIDSLMATVPGDSTDSDVVANNKYRIENVMPPVQEAHEVIEAVEKLDETYSVRKQLRTVNKSEKMLSNFAERGYRGNGLPIMGNHAKVQAFLHNGTKTFAIEGTPIETSRATSLSDLTIESEPKCYDFGLLKNRLNNPKTSIHSDVNCNNSVVTKCSDKENNNSMADIENGLSNISISKNLSVGANSNANNIKPTNNTDNVDQEVPKQFQCENNFINEVPLCSGKQAQFGEDLLECSSSLSSLDSEDGSNLLQDCITSAIPVSKTDFSAAISPNQLRQQNQSYVHQGMLNFLNSPDDTQYEIVHQQVHTTANLINQRNYFDEKKLSKSSKQFHLITDDYQSNTGNTNFDNEHQENFGLSNSSNGSLVLGGDAKSLMRSRNQPKILKDDEYRTSSEEKSKLIRGGTKKRNCKLKNKNREDGRCFVSGNKDDSSKSSNNKYKINRNSESSSNPCTKCHSQRPSVLPTSGSLGKLEDSTGHRWRRKNHSSSCVRPTVPQCSRVHDITNLARSRSAHPTYFPGVTRIYPRVEKIESVVLDGIATMVARGEKVHYGKGHLVPISSTVATPHARHILLKEAAFMQDQPTPALLHSAMDIPKTYQLVSSTQTKKNKKKEYNVTKKKIGLKERLKKLISSSDESKSCSKNQNNNSTVQKKKNGFKQRESEESCFNQIPKNDNVDSPLITQRSEKNSIKYEMTSSGRAINSFHSSSLSLSSSSTEDDCISYIDTFQKIKSSKTIYPTISSITSNHVPKSPCAKSRMSINKSSLNRLGINQIDFSLKKSDQVVDKPQSTSIASFSSASSSIGVTVKLKQEHAHSSSSSLHVVSVHEPPASKLNASAMAVNKQNKVERVVQEVTPFNSNNCMASD